MTRIVDTTSFTTASEFNQAMREIEYPARPRKPEHTMKESEFGSKAEYLRALADATEAYEAEMEVYKQEISDYRDIQGHIAQDFRQFAIEEFVDNDVPEEIKSLVYSAAYERGHSAGFEEVYNVMDDYAEIANQAFSAGKNAKG